MLDATEEKDYLGVFISHWKCPRFVVSKGRRFFGLLKIEEAWQLVFPEGVELPDEVQPSHRRKQKTRDFKMTLKGALGPRGRFGFLGICRRQLKVIEIVSWEEIQVPPKYHPCNGKPLNWFLGMVFFAALTATVMPRQDIPLYPKLIFAGFVFISLVGWVDSYWENKV